MAAEGRSQARFSVLRLKPWHSARERIAAMFEMSKLSALTPAQWASSLLNQVAYIKPVEADGAVAYAIHAADGTQLGLSADRETAFAAVRQHELEPMSVH
jgi:hypothetical protein